MTVVGEPTDVPTQPALDVPLPLDAAGDPTIALSAEPRDPHTLVERLAASVVDPVLRVLVAATLVGRLGRGVFLAVTAVYLTLVVGLHPAQVAAVLTVSGAAGVAASAPAGYLADRFRARRLMFAFMALEGVALCGYVAVQSFAAALVVAALVGTFDSAGNTVRMAVIARAFEGPARVHARAVLRTVTNLSIAVGSLVGGVALALDSDLAFRLVIGASGAVFALSSLVVLRLPARVDAHVAERTRPAPARASLVERPRSPWRDPRYLTLSVLSAVFGMQFGLAEVGVPLWIVHHTQAPTAVVAALLILNTIVVVLFQVPLSRGTDDLRHAARVMIVAGGLMAVACAAYELASGHRPWVAVAILVAAALAHAFAEVLSQAAAWGLSFELADPRAPGAYQGVFSMGYNLGAMAAPVLLTAAIGLGMGGWALLATVFVASALGTTTIAFRAAHDGAAATSR